MRIRLRHPAILRFLGFIAAVVIRIWMSTISFRLDFRATGPQPADPRKQRFIIAFWHDSILCAAAFSAKAHVLISLHSDGELIAQACRTLRIGVVRGSTTRGGSAGLMELIEKSTAGHLVITPDGPRGPRHRVQLGVILLASKTGLPIVAFAAGYARAWRAGSWDQMAIPWPWTTVYAVGTPPITVPPRLTRGELESYRTLVEEQFLAATTAAERWAETGICPPALEVTSNDLRVAG